MHIAVFFLPLSRDVRIVIGNTLDGNFSVVIAATDSQVSASTWSRVQIVARSNQYFFHVGLNETRIFTQIADKRPAPSTLATVYASIDPTSLYSFNPGERVNNRIHGFFYPFKQIPNMGTTIGKTLIGQNTIYSEFRLRIKIRFTQANVDDTEIVYFSSSNSTTGDYYPKIYVQNNQVCAQMYGQTALCDDGDEVSREHDREEWHNWEYTVKENLQTLES